MNDLGPEEKKKRSQRNLAIALLVGGFVVIIYLVTMLKLGGSIANR